MMPSREQSHIPPLEKENRSKLPLKGAMLVPRRVSQKKQRHFYEASKFQDLSFPWRCSRVASTLDGKPRFNVQLTPPVFVPVPIWLCKTVTGNGFCQQGMDLRTAQKRNKSWWKAAKRWGCSWLNGVDFTCWECPWHVVLVFDAETYEYEYWKCNWSLEQPSEVCLSSILLFLLLSRSDVRRMNN